MGNCVFAKPKGFVGERLAAAAVGVVAAVAVTMFLVNARESCPVATPSSFAASLVDVLFLADETLGWAFFALAMNWLIRSE